MLADRQTPARRRCPRSSPSRTARADHSPQHRRDEALDDGSGEGNPPHGQQLFEVEMQPDAEHEQDDADLGELLRQRLIRQRSQACGTDGDPA